LCEYGAIRTAISERPWRSLLYKVPNSRRKKQISRIEIRFDAPPQKNSPHPFPARGAIQIALFIIIFTIDLIQNNNKAIEYIEDKYGINFTKKINVLGNLEVIKGLVREGIGNVILPYYSVYKDIRKGTFKVIAKIDEIKDGYELIITKDKKDLSQITKFIDLVKSHKIVMEGSRN